MQFMIQQHYHFFFHPKIQEVIVFLSLFLFFVKLFYLQVTKSLNSGIHIINVHQMAQFYHALTQDRFRIIHNYSDHSELGGF